MNNHVTYDMVRARLEENGIPHGSIETGAGSRIVVSQRGGRIFGPFLGDRGESLLWTSGHFSDAAAFRRFLDSADWNIGGDRVWIAPEHRYNVRDRSDFFGSYTLPQQVDPGQYRLEMSGRECRLRQEVALDVHGPSAPPKRLRFDRRVGATADPLRELADPAEDVAFAGYVHEVHLVEEEDDGAPAETWNLAQVNPGGHAYVAVTGGATYTDFYAPAGPRHQAFAGYTRILIDARHMFKVGYKAPRVLGRMGYHHRLDGERECLFVRAFFCDPSGTYTMEPASRPGDRGYPVQVFNDDGTYGGFGEIECSGRAIGGDTGRSASTDVICSWFYVGVRERLRPIASILLGAELT
jgi:hypothetical protein